MEDKIVKNVKTSFPDFCCKNCGWVKEELSTLIDKKAYRCSGRACITYEDDFCSLFFKREESQQKQPL